MKNVLLSALMSFGAVCSINAADGDSFVFDDLTYTILSEVDKTCELGNNQKHKFSGAVEIPSTVRSGDKEYTVIALGEKALYAPVGMTSLKLPETLVTIKAYGISYCIDMKELVLPNSVTTVESRGCYGNYVESLTLSSGIREYKRESFSGYPKIKILVIPEGAEIIHDEAFNFSSAETIKIANTVTSIGKMSFAGCEKLREITIPGSVREIGDEAFDRGKRLNSVTLESGDMPLSFGRNVFGNTIYLGTYDDPVAKITDLNLNRVYTCVSSEPKEMPFAYKPTLTTINFGSAFTSIPVSAFEQCTGLTELTFPATLSTIGAAAFAGCDNLKSIKAERATCPSAASTSFSQKVFDNALLDVSDDAYESYKTDIVWGRFVNIKAPQSAIDSIGADSDMTVTDIYTLCGVRVEGTPAPGLYLVRRADGSVTKMVIK